MMKAINQKQYAAPDVDLQEVLRYAACREMAEDVLALAQECVALAQDALR